MTAQGEAVSIRRILVALNDTEPSTEALRAVVELADRLKAELLGLFVEDENLLRLAGLPFAREAGSASAATRRLEDGVLQRSLRAQAVLCEQALFSVAQRRQVRCSFRVARGTVVTEVVTAAREADLLVVSLNVREDRLGATAGAILSEPSRPLLLMPHGVRIKPRVAVVFDGSPAARRALETATQLVAGSNEGLTVFLPDGHAGPDPQREQEVRQLRVGGANARLRRLRADLADLGRAARDESVGLLVLVEGQQPPLEPGMARLLGECECAVFLMG